MTHTYIKIFHYKNTYNFDMMIEYIQAIGLYVVLCLYIFFPTMCKISYLCVSFGRLIASVGKQRAVFLLSFTCF